MSASSPLAVNMTVGIPLVAAFRFNAFITLRPSIPGSMRSRRIRSGFSRPLFIYAKKAYVSVIPGMPEFLKEFTIEKAWGPDGCLSEKGLIPVPDKERASFSSDARSLRKLASLN